MSSMLSVTCRHDMLSVTCKYAMLSVIMLSVVSITAFKSFILQIPGATLLKKKV